MVLRSVGRKENQIIIEKNKLMELKKNELVIIRPHPRDLISNSNFVEKNNLLEIQEGKYLLYDSYQMEY